MVHEIVNFLFTVPAENDIQLYNVDTSVKSFKGITKMSYQDMCYYQQSAKVIDSIYNHHGCDHMLQREHRVFFCISHDIPLHIVGVFFSIPNVV